MPVILAGHVGGGHVPALPANQQALAPADAGSVGDEEAERARAGIQETLELGLLPCGHHKKAKAACFQAAESWRAEATLGANLSTLGQSGTWPTCRCDTTRPWPATHTHTQRPKGQTTFAPTNRHHAAFSLSLAKLNLSAPKFKSISLQCAAKKLHEWHVLVLPSPSLFKIMSPSASRQSHIV